LCGSCGVHWRLNRRVFIILGIFVGVGVVIGLYTAFNVRIKVDHISQSLLDTNLKRVVRPTAGFVGILLGRIFAFFVMMGLTMLVCMHRWTLFLVFGLATYHGFNVVINLYWIIARFGVATGSVLFTFYIFILIAVMVTYIVMTVYCMRVCTPIRGAGFRNCFKWSEVGSACISFAIACAVIAVTEFLIFYLLISKIVFIV